MPEHGCDPGVHRVAELRHRVVWGELRSNSLSAFVDLAGRLKDALEPLGSPQIVHADLTRNVFRPGAGPSCHRHLALLAPAYAEDVVLADALCWHDASAQLLQQTGVTVPAVARALLFRMATTYEAAVSGIEGVNLHDELRRYRHAAEAIGL